MNETAGSLQPSPKPKRPKPPRPVDALLSIDEGGAFLGLSRWTVSAMLESGQLPGFILKAGKRKRIWRIRKDALQQWIARKEAETKKLVQGAGGNRILAVIGGQEHHAD